jgi:hypothetical protein
MSAIRIQAPTVSPSLFKKFQHTTVHLRD